MKLFLAAALCGLLVACATPKYNTKITNETSDLEVPALAVNEKVKTLEWEQDYPVKVMINKVPEGIRWNEKDELEIEPAYRNRYIILGKANSAQAEGTWSAFAKSLFFFVHMHDKHSKGRDIFCKAQVPFRVILGPLWMVIPLQWPCFAWHKQGNSLQSMELLKKEVQRLAYAMGGNLVLVQSQVSIRSMYGVVLQANLDAPLQTEAQEVKPVVSVSSIQAEPTHVEESDNAVDAPNEIGVEDTKIEK